MATPAHVTFIHGLANKPSLANLRRIWLEALSFDQMGNLGFDLGADGVLDAFVYWADLFYETPLTASDYETIANELGASVEHAMSPLPSNAWISAMRRHYPEAGELYPDPPATAALPAYERIPLPNFLKERIMAEYLREAHAYLFNVNGVRDVIRKRVLEALNKVPNGTQRILMTHSQGTFIAYDVMTACEDCPPVHGFMTIGSPLGIDEIQDKLTWSRSDGFPAKLLGDWVNIYDPFDVVSRADPRLANDFCKAGAEIVIDVEESNWGTWRHSATKYLKGPQLRRHLRRLCGRDLP